MKTKVGIGASNQTNSFAAGKEAAMQAMEQGGIDRPDFALIFCGGKHSPEEFLKGVNEIIPDTPKAGGSSFGIITDSFIGYDGFEVGVTIFSSDKIRFEIFSQGGLNENEYEAGQGLGQKLQGALKDDSRGLWVFYDSSKQQNPPMLNFATPLFAALEQYLPSDLAVAGGGFLSDMMLSSTYQFVNNEIYSQHVVGILVSGECKMETAILHGCQPCSDYITITKANGPLVIEIDNQPALEMIDELLGPDHGVKFKDFAMNVTLGVNRGDKFGDFKESDYANRLTLAVDEGSKALVMFEPDLTEGTEVQLMRRNMEPDYVEEVIEEVNKKLSGSDPVYAFYINCGGRAKPFSGVNFEDAAEVQKAIGPIPLSGFYSGVEVARVGQNLQPLDWTGVLSVLAEV
ncbi:FIST N-terminal domain-containing protein [Algoriphagus sp. CAU 1675]|uniref:FIST signal transduction protein n=1 Tax=Algoriphagus sp. CAU 1675 TaxID=3032597 RepID=UPI0023DB98D2|nr:FIST N-terminal domain-containing protein [Algoriphagus sp. CAU 1675]MDF2156738.1 FIST N-terminal domain-containing protein [Algoriphagus sp. CAU 1675]